MALNERKIEKYEDNIKLLTDYPSEDGVSAEQLKAMFDGRGDKEIKDSINGIVKDLTASSGASEIGSSAGNVQRELDLKVEKENGEVVGRLDVSTESGEGKMSFIPAAFDSCAEIKISDTGGQCAALGIDYDGKLTVSYGAEYLDEKEGVGTVYTTLTNPKLDLMSAQLSDSEMSTVRRHIGLANVDNTADVDKPISRAVELALMSKLGDENPCIAGTVIIDGAKIYNTGNELVLYRPMVDIVPECELRLGGDMEFNGHTVYHTGNLKDITAMGTKLTEEEKNMVRLNIGITDIVGDIEGALDEIIALQERYIGGESA